MDTEGAKENVLPTSEVPTVLEEEKTKLPSLGEKKGEVGTRVEQTREEIETLRKYLLLADQPSRPDSEVPSGQGTLVTAQIEEEYNTLVKEANRREQEVLFRGKKFPGPEILNKEGADATIGNRALSSTIHFENYSTAGLILQRMLPGLSRRVLLEIGSGAGIFSDYLARRLKPKLYLATDYQPDVINYGRVLEGESLKFAVLDATNMGLAAESVDGIVACEVAEHVSLQKILAEAYRVLKKDGVLVGTTPDRASHPNGEFSFYPFHQTEYTQEELRSLLKESGFQEIEIFRLINKGIVAEKNRYFRIEQLINKTYRLGIKLFPKGSRGELVLNNFLRGVYTITKNLSPAKTKDNTSSKRRELSFPERYKGTRLIFDPEDRYGGYSVALVFVLKK